MKTNYIIPPESGGRSIYDILKKNLKISRRLIIALKKDNSIELNGAPVFTNHIVKENDILSIDLSEKESSENINPEKTPIDVIYEDEHILAINKPRGMAVHPTLNYESGTLANAVMYYYKDTPFVFRPVNRLDKDTSGLVLIAKNKFSAERLSKQLAEGNIKKTYTAIVCGHPSSLSGTINEPISRENDSIIKRCVSDNGAHSKTVYKVIETKNSKSLVEVSPITGRTHQIRVHMAHIGCPLYADFLYGEEIENESFYLHCGSLEFNHPFTEKKVNLTCNLPEYFKNPLL